jgi:hypothetical protein
MRETLRWLFPFGGGVPTMGGKGLEGSWAASAQRGIKVERLPSTPLGDTSVHSPIHNDFSRSLRLKICRNTKRAKDPWDLTADGSA